MSAPDAQTLALQLARRILTDALVNADERPSDIGFVRTLAGRIGELQQAIRSALMVMDQLAPDESGDAR